MAVLSKRGDLVSFDTYPHGAHERGYSFIPSGDPNMHDAFTGTVMKHISNTIGVASMHIDVGITGSSAGGGGSGGSTYEGGIWG